jgi:hypothetical protein
MNLVCWGWFPVSMIASNVCVFINLGGAQVGGWGGGLRRFELCSRRAAFIKQILYSEHDRRDTLRYSQTNISGKTNNTEHVS